MKVYLDTSVILSRLLNQTNQYANWGKWEMCFTSVLTRVEFLRAIDRLRLGGFLTDTERVEIQDQFNTFCSAAHQVALSQDLLNRACMAMPTVLGTLDAIHLVTALRIKESQKFDLTLITHDRQLANGARVAGLCVAGVDLE